MTTADRQRWDARHAAGGRRTQEPSPWLVQTRWAFAGLQTVLDIATGTAEDLSWLADQGFDVVGLDVSPIAIGKARERDTRLDVRVWDADDGLPEGRWDLVLTLHFLDRRLWPQIRRAVRPGGVFVAEVLCEGTPFGRAFQAQRGELLRAFVDWDVLAWEQRTLHDGRVVSRLAARRPEGR